MLSLTSSLFARLLVALLFALTPCMGSTTATLTSRGYSMRVWQTEDGLPQNAVTAVTQTRDGYLWVGTYRGLARFDGEHFRNYTPSNTRELRDQVTVSLFEDSAGALWIGHGAGTLTRHTNGRFEAVDFTHASDHEGIRALGTDENGQLWALRDSGSLNSVSEGTRISTLAPGESPGMLAWARSSTGKIWLAERGSVLHLQQGKLVDVPIDQPRLNPFVVCVAASADGGLWVLRDNRVKKWKEDRWTEDRGEFPWTGSVSCALELRDGTLAVGTVESGLYLVFDDGKPAVHIDQKVGLPQNWIRCLYQDREGNLWLGAGSGGLVALHPTAFSVETPPDGWQGRSILSVAEGRSGTLWVGTEGAGVYRLKNNEWKRYGEDSGLENLYIWALSEDSVGRLWAGNWDGGPLLLEQDKFQATPPARTVLGPVQALWANPDADELLVGARNGLLRFREGNWEWLLKTKGAYADAVSAIARDFKGVTWLGLSKGGLGRLEGGKLTTYGRELGLTGDVYCLFPDEDGTLWIGASDGLGRLKNGTLTKLGLEHGLAGSIVAHIEEDDLGFLWMSSNRGLQRVRKSDLHRCADGETPAFSSRIYDRNDGLPTAEFTAGLQATACKALDGTLWFTTTKGLISIAPNRIHYNTTPPPMAFEGLLVDGTPAANTAGTVARELPPRHGRLEFRYTALSFAAPGKVLFKYRLDGLDKDWIDAGTKRTAFYSQLPAGKYRFRVIGCNNDGVWNTEGVSLAFTVAPFFWQTWWFTLLAMASVLTGVALFARFLTRRRMQREIEEMERRHVLERERARIAQDIHDDVGASLSRIAMLSQPAPSQLAEPGRAAAVLTRIYSTARDVTRALDEIVWAVDPRHDTLDSLADYMGRFAQDLLAAANTRCRLDLPVEVPAWPIRAETRHNLFLAFKEALNNAIKHAGATEIRVSLSLHADSFVVSVEDNGRGLEAQGEAKAPDRLNSGHGLGNMQARLSRADGRCEISSQPGAGTKVAFIVRVSGPTPSSFSKSTP